MKPLRVFVLLVSSTAILAACRTYTGAPGRCKILKKCTPIMKLIKSRPSVRVYDDIRRTVCGFEDDDPKICCPISRRRNLERLDDNRNEEETMSSPSPVDGHPNLRLLEHEICGPVRVEPRIHGGEDARLLEFPWMVLLAYVDSEEPQDRHYPDFRCGGSVIARKYVLTAAHCVTDLPENLKLAFLRVGEHNLTTEIDCEVIDNSNTICAEKHQDVGVEKVLVHPEYSTRSWRNDIALIRRSIFHLRFKNIEANIQPVLSRLNVSLKFGASSVRPICLPVSGSVVGSAGSWVLATGWGTTGNSRPSEALLKVRLPLLSLDRCRLAYRSQPFTRLWHRQLCAGGEPGRDTCAGDSGGPLQTVVPYLDGPLRTVQLGLVSFGRVKCAESGAPGVYTHLAYYLPWLLDIMEE